MSTDLSAIQVTALHGLIQNTGIAPPDIAQALAEYVKYAAIQSYYILESHLTSSPATSISISSIDGTEGQLTVASGTYIKGQSLKVVGVSGGTGTGLTDGVTYYVLNDATGTSIQITNSYQNALAGVAGLVTGTGTVTVAVFETKTGAPVPALVTIANTLSGDDVTKTFSITYTTSYTVTALAWLTNDFLQVDINGTVKIPGVHYNFSSDFSSITFVSAPASGDTVTIKILPRKIFYTLAKDFPMALGSTPQQFNSVWGDGNLIRRAHARTSGWFNNDGCKTFANVLGQAQGYASQTRSVMKSAALAEFGTGGPAAGATGGFSKIAGNDSSDLAVVGTGFQKAAGLINLQNPWASFSAALVIQEAIKRNAEKTGNLHVTVLGKTFVDPATQKPRLIDSSFIAELLDQAQAQQKVLRDTVTDRALADLIDQNSDSADVASIQQLLGIQASGLTRFSQLLDPVTTLGTGAVDQIKETTQNTNLIQGLAINLKKFCRIKASADARSLGENLQQMQNIPGTELNALTQPTTQAQMNTLLSILGTGSGQHGAQKAEDCLGHTNYNEVMTEAVKVLQNFHAGSVATGSMATIVSEMNTLRNKIETGTTSNWDAALVSAKNTIDPAAVLIAAQTSALNLAPKVLLYNRMAETHNTSEFLENNVPYYVQSGGLNTVLSFVSNLPGYGKNTDGFTAQELIENCCTNTVTGQAIVAAMREGRNVQALENSNLSSDTGSEAARAVPVPETGVGLIGGGAWPAPVDPYANLPRSSTGL